VGKERLQAVTPSADSDSTSTYTAPLRENVGQLTDGLQNIALAEKQDHSETEEEAAESDSSEKRSYEFPAAYYHSYSNVASSVSNGAITPDNFSDSADEFVVISKSSFPTRRAGKGSKDGNVVQDAATDNDASEMSIDTLKASLISYLLLHV
jgi:hypothetical protein